MLFIGLVQWELIMVGNFLCKFCLFSFLLTLFSKQVMFSFSSHHDSLPCDSPWSSMDSNDLFHYHSFRDDITCALIAIGVYFNAQGFCCIEQLMVIFAILNIYIMVLQLRAFLLGVNSLYILLRKVTTSQVQFLYLH